MSQIVRFSRPETPESICSMFVEDDTSTETHVRRMVSLGYKIVDVSPPPTSDPDALDDPYKGTHLWGKQPNA